MRMWFEWVFGSEIVSLESFFALSFFLILVI